MDASELTRYASVVLAALFVGAMVSGAINPWARPRPGREVMQLRTSFRARILLYRWYLLPILGIFLGVRLLPGTWTTEGADVVSLLLVAGWLLFPVSYYFTDQGVGLHTGRFWTWDNFDSYRRAGGVVQLRGSEGGNVSLFLNHPQQQAILPLLRRKISQRR
ncbi:MAG: hypothetical protein OXR64_03280 [Chloroflexota bacterium]|nr:hypothetical protein [Chloroflexota bacterium]MDE2918846.1 hypothetical protein [Chloroflexota bacterium]